MSQLIVASVIIVYLAFITVGMIVLPIGFCIFLWAFISRIKS